MAVYCINPVPWCMYVTWESCATVVPACLCAVKSRIQAVAVLMLMAFVMNIAGFFMSMPFLLGRWIAWFGASIAAASSEPHLVITVLISLNSSRIWPSLEDFLVYNKLLPCITTHCMWAACDMTHSLFLCRSLLLPVHVCLSEHQPKLLWNGKHRQLLPALFGFWSVCGKLVPGHRVGSDSLPLLEVAGNQVV